MGFAQSICTRMAAPLFKLFRRPAGTAPLRGRASTAAIASDPAATATLLNQQACRAHIAWPSGRRHAVAGRPLRVLRVVDACHGPASAGRMVISGRLADVCAELDRLAEREAALA